MRQPATIQLLRLIACAGKTVQVLSDSEVEILERLRRSQTKLKEVNNHDWDSSL